ncbi:phosphate/phosphite/phosphonate ABC transporter substrate-binding protein [Luteibacter sahnii]|uniref:phosphate/phosphite/phosphonate ABC transporter substrate-binding protein n=1 Tax=Luteibacter sahnii TaxID=3021977 RepID=UPI002A6B6737|nr:phosphate/phosphite/phosphonate ABC transporter substrate-binding protein [Luteibacter sp. PPL193]MDY1548359.1 phosphate/phosphite/phosphonate ABC transporter substrate-binding protein [Luteibacter sp. PPL193]
MRGFRGWRALIGSVLVQLAFTLATPALADDDAGAPMTFGILPIGGPAESLEAWRPLIDDLSASLARPVRPLSVSSYEGIAQAIGEQRVDIAFLSGRLALEAVTRHNMRVIAQLTRGDGSLGYRAVLLTGADSRIRTLDQMLAHPGQWRYARGEALSASGYLVPETQVFAARGLDSDTFFKSVRVDNHQNNALAVANGEADVATNNSADLERFQQRFPEPYARLHVLWTSSLIPHAVIVVRRDLPPAWQDRIAAFITRYGKGKDATRELANLKRIHDISGFAPATDTVLTPFADIEYSLDMRRASTAQWVSDAARQARMRKLRDAHERLVAYLSGK